MQHGPMKKMWIPKKVPMFEATNTSGSQHLVEPGLKTPWTQTPVEHSMLVQGQPRASVELATNSVVQTHKTVVHRVDGQMGGGSPMALG